LGMLAGGRILLVGSNTFGTQKLNCTFKKFYGAKDQRASEGKGSK